VAAWYIVQMSHARDSFFLARDDAMQRSMSRLCYKHDHRLSVRPSVTSVDCDHTVPPKSGNGHMTG